MTKQTDTEELYGIWSLLDNHFDTALLSDEDTEKIDQAILALKQQWQLEARIDELNSIEEPDKHGVWDRGYPDRPMSVNERIAELEAQLTQSQNKENIKT